MAESLDKNTDRQIAAVLVVGFHHAFGPIVEFCIPPLPCQKITQQQTLEKLELPEEWSFLPFLALPDGAHQKDEDFAYFHLPPVPSWSVATETTLFGISCNRQIASKDLIVKTPDITRSIVQKAVVVLARQPIFGPLRQKLAVITAAWFNQRDFTKLDILHNLYSSLNNTFYGPIDDSTLYMGTSLRELVYKFRSKTLMLLKLLLLEKRILFYGYPVEKLCTFQYSLISLVPGLLRNLKDSGSPYLDTTQLSTAEILVDGSKESLLKYMGLPLHIFEKGSFFQPYVPLQQIDMLSSDQTHSYIAGTTNQIFFHHKSDTKIDVLVNVETGTLEFYNQSLVSCVSHTIADRRWMESIVRVVNDTWSQNDPSRPMQNTYLGSDDYLRARFEEYILSLLSSVKYAQAHHQLDDVLDNLGSETVIGENEEHNYLTDYGMKWLRAWWQTNNFKKWNQYTDYEIYEIVEPGHPGMGHISMTDLQNTLSNRLRDLQLNQNLAPIRNTLSKAVSGGAKVVSKGSTKFMKGVDAFWNELERSSSETTRNGEPSSSSSTTATSTVAATQQVGKLFSNFSSFLSRKTKEFSQTMEEAVSSDSNVSSPSSRRTSRIASIKRKPGDDDTSSAFINVDYPGSVKDDEYTDNKTLDI
ncbi:hypothetical protein G6F70_000019 [Rhizopus microsporus]|nr:hypothetical protein G6F71_002148 [Rhizopus microsporus]KAG1204882.1 hypothetical protein G6F70_000019 [Rhizopus microsporus]KAG1216508.1 hypothetical protein G6F69_000079 [Rhizopus microsporus]KAG1236969.1 hypothetical protein G6F67_001578 [Rhizopus microsporus]KAG1269522.1 hypothetical protein G6F68_000243 [Rhizopus microsporus]